MHTLCAYIRKLQLLCAFYSEKPVFATFSVEKLRERFSNLSLTRRNLSVSFSNLSVSVATDGPKSVIDRIGVAEKHLFPSPDDALQNVKPILHWPVTKQDDISTTIPVHDRDKHTQN